MAGFPRTPSLDGWRRTSLRGRPLVVTDDKPSFWDKAAAGAWEPELLAAIEALLVPGDAFLDIGAWVGPTALHAALLGADVVAVEADPAAASRLAGNVAANPELASRIRIVEKAASPLAGSVTLGAPRKQGDSMASLLHADAATHWQVETVAPAALLALAAPPAPGKLLIKIDIEGGEYDVLPALGAALEARSTRAVIAAFHPRLLAGAGWQPPRLAAATEACLAAFAGWHAGLLDAGPSGGAELAAVSEAMLAANVTVVFTPPS